MTENDDNTPGDGCWYCEHGWPILNPLSGQRHGFKHGYPTGYKGARVGYAAYCQRKVIPAETQRSNEE